MIGGKKILKGIDIELDNGVYGFLGPNGAGKTTLIRCLTGIYKLKKDCGDIVLDEKLHVTDREYINSSGYLPQSFGLFKDMKVRDALMYLAALKGMKEDEAKIDVEECLEKVNLSDRINDKVKTLSGGMVRRLGIAQALLGNPRIIIFDEPTAGLDPVERARFKDIIKNIPKDR
ncbi:MAG TPA: ABC transporter ATP-binding protein, partial [Eubacterium sp.]|nr:ABC transporter ATP-binding protein [Eubacterium sp.]